MLPEILHLHFNSDLPIIHHDLRIYTYGLMLVIGFLCSVWLAKRLAKSVNFDPQIFENAAMLALLTGVIGARLSHILENLHDFTSGTFWQNVGDMLNLRAGGLTFYGGLLLAFPVLLLYG